MSRAIQITDHSDQAVSRLLSQFKEKPRIEGLIRSFVGPVQTIENELFNVRDLRWVDTAIGKQLDNLGIIVGQSRLGRNDTDYRVAIKAQIAINTSKSDPESTLSAFNLFTGSTQSSLLELFPACVQLTANINISAIDPALLYDTMERVIPAGVCIAGIIWTVNFNNTFTVGPATFGKGFDDLLNPGVGGILAVLVIRP